MTGSLGTILVVDDEPRIHRVLTPGLAASGYSSLHATLGEEALRLAALRSPNAILLDLGLPDMDGHEVLRKLREFTRAPVIIISGRTRESEKIKALDAGANDYVEKPLQMAELLARIRVALRDRKPINENSKSIILGTLAIDPGTQHLMVPDKRLRLTKHEYALLVLLARHRGRVLSHSQILTAIWGPVHANDTMYLRVYIGQLRQKLERNPAAPQRLITEPGVGYRLHVG